MAHASRTRCPKCDYPFIALANFDGDSRRHTATFEAPYRTPTTSYGCQGLIFEILFDLFGEVFKAIGLVWRRRKVQKLKQEILPSFPGSLICLKCLRVVERP